MPPSIQPFQDEGYTREVVLTYEEWRRVLSKFEQSRGWGKERIMIRLLRKNTTATREKWDHAEKYLGHIGPDKEGLRFEYHYGEDGME